MLSVIINSHIRYLRKNKFLDCKKFFPFYSVVKLRIAAFKEKSHLCSTKAATFIEKEQKVQSPIVNERKLKLVETADIVGVPKKGKPQSLERAVTKENL